MTFERQTAFRADSRARAKTGETIAARIPMIAMTTKSSISVNPRLGLVVPGRICISMPPDLHVLALLPRLTRRVLSRPALRLITSLCRLRMHAITGSDYAVSGVRNSLGVETFRTCFMIVPKTALCQWRGPLHLL